MNLEILSDLIITKVYSATTMIQKMQKPKEIIVQTGQLSLNMREKTMYVSEGKTYSSDINNLVIFTKGLFL